MTVPVDGDQPPTGLMVALHGWGANALDLASLVPMLDLPSYEFIFPDAPFTHPQVPGGKMWYDFQGNQGLAESRKLLLEWLLSLESSTGIPLSRTILSGFSQGGAMTLEVGLSLPLAGLISLSGYLHPMTQTMPATLPPVLIVHGRQDAVVPVAAAQKARDSLQGLGAAVQYQELDMGHEIRPEVLPLMERFVVNAMAQQD
ncbi:alpha/beta hydrolase [Neosynechococcus sphagnicola]|uniref:alpha/beta hydrolase n=1 Tax=Neosynechococcus sphagnicola TaxID=1501145 RepID=UPI0030841C6E